MSHCDVMTPGVALAAALALTPLVPVSTDACYGCHEGATRDSHPVAIEYRETTRGEFRLRSMNMASGFGSTVARDFLVNGKVECTSCHATHEQETDGKYRMRIDGDNFTKLCFGCHAGER